MFRYGNGDKQGGGRANPDVREASQAYRPGGAGVYGALDLGTNNCRLLVAKPSPNGFRVIDAFSRIVRLGEGLTHSGRLSEAAIRRTIDALHVCAAKMRRRGVTRARAVATEACRRASNCDDFLWRAEKETGVCLETITTAEEARLSLYGCASLFDPTVPHALVFDIGGGSTELSWLGLPETNSGDARAFCGPASNGHNHDPWHVAERTRFLAWHSMPFGVVSLAERYGGDTVTPALYETMVREVEDAVRPFEAEYGLSKVMGEGRMQMLGTSGTVTTLAGVHRDLPRYDRAMIDGCYMDFETVKSVSDRIAAMSFDERAEHPCIGRDRADLVVAGCAILEALCRTWPVGRLRVADRGLREGILYNLMRADTAEPLDARRRAGSAE